MLFHPRKKFSARTRELNSLISDHAGAGASGVGDACGFGCQTKTRDMGFTPIMGYWKTGKLDFTGPLVPWGERSLEMGYCASNISVAGVKVSL